MKKRNLVGVLLSTLCAAGIGLVAPAHGQTPVDIPAGEAFAKDNCARCHAIGEVGPSPHDKAPPLRSLHTRYPIDSLAEALAEGIVTGHEGMPEFQLDSEQVENLLAYIKSISN